MNWRRGRGSVVWTMCLFLGIAGPIGAVRGQPPTEEQVARARQRGVDYLQSQQKPDGSWEYKDHEVGITALCVVALIENGVPLTSPAVQKGYEFVKKGSAKLKGTYDLSLATVMLARFGDRRDKPLLKELAARLIAGQMESGGWHYTCPGQELDAEKVLRDPTALPKPKEGFGDNSCTQFAVLGLWVASRSGVNIDRTLSKVAKRFNKSQQDDGGWSYVQVDAKSGSSPSMTGAGLFCLAVAEAAQIREFLKSGKKPEEGSAAGKSLLESQVFSKGLKRTGEFVKGVGPGSPRYFLWSVERIGVLLGLKDMGEVDWFLQGADALIKTQTNAGGWPTSWPDTDKGGLSDTAFAVLFLRKANLGSDISRLLKGEQEKKFEIVDRQPAALYSTLDEALAAAQAGETIRINGPGPYKIGHLELKKDLTIQAGFGYAPIFKYEVGANRLGIRLKPETDPNARDMLAVSGAQVTLEGLRFQMDPPKTKNPVPWRSVTVKSGGLRMLNCSVSEANKQGTTGVVVESPGRTVIRNCLFVGCAAVAELASDANNELIIDNTVAFGAAGVVLAGDPKTNAKAETKLTLTNTAFQVKEVLNAAKYAGKLDVISRHCVYQADWIASRLLASPTDTKNRTWSGAFNVYDVKQAVGSAGKPAAVTLKDGKSWVKFWGNVETDIHCRVAPFVGLRQIGNYSHDASPQDWQLEFPVDADSTLIRARVGVNAYLSGSGIPYDEYRSTIDYTTWKKGDADQGNVARND
ncbi:MAG: hypothetical protein ACKV0T_26980 [Planctomycetales bacterium]